MSDWAFVILALLVEELGNVLGGQVDIAVVGKVWVGLVHLDHIDLVSVSLEAFTGNFEIALWA